jgi:hypothetical protein
MRGGYFRHDGEGVGVHTKKLSEPGSELRFYFDLMALIGDCYTVEDLLSRMRTSTNLTAWLAYLQVRHQEEEARIQAMMNGVP